MTEQLPATRGRPSTYNIELAHEICNEIGACTTSTKVLCEQHEHWPDHRTLCKWRWSHDDFGELYSRAMRRRARLYAEEVVEIADEDNGDATIQYDKHGNPYAKMNGQTPQRAALRAKVRQWLAERLASEEYGNRVDITSGGEKIEGNTAHIDQRIQSIVMQAALRGSKAELPKGITPDALKLLE